MTGLLEGKRLLVTGVLTEQSIAFSVARTAAEQGARSCSAGFGRSASLTRRIAKRLPGEPPVIELDVTSEDDLAALPSASGSTSTASTACCTPSASRPRAPSAAACSRPPGRTSASRCTCRPGPTPRSPGPACR